MELNVDAWLDMEAQLDYEREMPFKLLICGSRDATPQMIHLAKKAVERAKALGWHVIVGDASGVDSAVITTCCFIGVPFTFCGISSTPRNFCCPHHVATAYRRIEGNYLGRDRVMVDGANRVYAIWNGVSAGTMYTYRYARKLGKKADLWQAN